MDVKGLNKLRGIQGQVAQEPPVKENKPIVIDSYELDPINPLESIRKQRIVKGSGTSITNLNKLLKQFKDSKKMMKKMQGMNKFAKKGSFKLPFMQ